jgi:hypothetical protein
MQQREPLVQPDETLPVDAGTGQVCSDAQVFALAQQLVRAREQRAEVRRLTRNRLRSHLSLGFAERRLFEGGKLRLILEVLSGGSRLRDRREQGLKVQKRHVFGLQSRGYGLGAMRRAASI